MRLFIALDIEDAIRQRITTFMGGVRGFARDVRWVRPESLHITLKFIGEHPDEKLEGLKQALRVARGAPTTITFRGWNVAPGSFRVEMKSR